MNIRFSQATLFGFSILGLVFAVGLTACDGGSSSQSATPKVELTSSKAVKLYGQVRDDDGVFESGSVSAADANGKQVARSEWQNGEQYSIEIPAGTGFPVLLTAKAKHKGSKLVTLVAAVISPTLTKHDVTPNSTQVAQKAKALGGYTKKNMMQATLSTVNRPKGDRTVDGFRGDPTKQFGGWH